MLYCIIHLRIQLYFAEPCWKVHQTFVVVGKRKSCSHLANLRLRFTVKHKFFKTHVKELQTMKKYGKNHNKNVV